MILNKDLSEVVQYDFQDYPLYARRGLLSAHPNYAAPSHFHDDLELIAVQSGEMQYNVNGEILTMRAGEGIFVNSRQLHYGFSKQHRECDFICVLMHPMLLCITPAFERDYVAPLLGKESVAYVKLTEASAPGENTGEPCPGQITNDSQDPHTCENTYEPQYPGIRGNPDDFWKRRIWEKTVEIYRGTAENIPDAPLRAQAAFLEIWRLLFEHTGAAARIKPSGSQDLSSLKNMVSFLQRHYQEKLTLADIAVAGAVGQSKCCQLFSRYLHQTPNTCLNEYRLSRGAALLRETDLSVTEIAENTGFCGSSYFAETFRKWSGQTPGGYRRTARTLLTSGSADATLTEAVMSQ